MNELMLIVIHIERDTYCNEYYIAEPLRYHSIEQFLIDHKEAFDNCKSHWFELGGLSFRTEHYRRYDDSPYKPPEVLTVTEWYDEYVN